MTSLGPTICLSLTLNAGVMVECIFPGDNGRIRFFLAPIVDVGDLHLMLTQEEALEVSAKIHSAKEVTPVAKSITSKTNSAPKRKSFISTEEASNQKKASPRKMPKKCSECKQVKPCSEYFGRQLCQRNGKYIDCVVTLVG